MLAALYAVLWLVYALLLLVLAGSALGELLARRAREQTRPATW